MGGRRIYSQLFVRCLASVSADRLLSASELTMNFCNFIQQRLRAEDFQIPPHR